MREEVKWRVREARRAKKGETFFFFFTDESMRSGHCAKTNKRANVQHPWTYVNPLVSVLAHFLTMRPGSCRAATASSRWPGPLLRLYTLPTYSPSTLCSISLSLSFVLLVALSLAKLNLLTHMVPLAPLTSAHLSLSLSFSIIFSLFLTYRFFSASVRFIFLLIFY